jgi:hypothetical protein
VPIPVQNPFQVNSNFKRKCVRKFKERVCMIVVEDVVLEDIMDKMRTTNTGPLMTQIVSEGGIKWSMDQNWLNDLGYMPK